MDYIAILFFILLVISALILARIIQLQLWGPVYGGADDYNYDDFVDDTMGGYEIVMGGAEEGERRPFVFGIAPEYYKYIPISEKNKPKKTIDVRKGGETAYQELLKNKSKMGYRNKETGQMAICELNDLRHYKSIEDLLAKEKPESYSPELKSAADLRKAIEQYYDAGTVASAGGLVVFDFSFQSVVEPTHKKSPPSEAPKAKAKKASK